MAVYHPALTWWGRMKMRREYFRRFVSVLEGIGSIFGAPELHAVMLVVILFFSALIGIIKLALVFHIIPPAR